MTISEQDVTRIARLARIHISPEQQAQVKDELNGMLGIIEQLQAVDTASVEPMAHPLSAHQEITLRLRPDTAAATATPEQRKALMLNAPAEENGLFLVPTVIE